MSRAQSNIPFRNFFGAFLGSMAGIILSWYVPPVAVTMPIATFSGVVIGWWYDRLFKQVRLAYKQTRQNIPRIKRYTVNLSGRISSVLAKAFGVKEVVFGWSQKLMHYLAKAINGFLYVPVYLWQALKSFGGWLAKDQENYVRFVEVSTMIVLLLALPLVFEFFLAPQLSTTIEGSGVGFLIFFVVGIGIGGYTTAVDNDSSSRSRKLEILSRFRGLGLSLYVAVRHLLHSVGMAVYVAIALPWAAVILSAGLFGAYLVMPAVALARRFYSLARRSGHWLCFAVTLTMTGISWLVFSGGFNDPRVLWGVAATTGVLSGVATELVRRVALTLFARTWLGRMLIRRETEEVLMSPRDGEMTVFNGTYIGLVFGLGSMPMRKSTVGRFLRTLCIGLPAGKFSGFDQ